MQYSGNIQRIIVKDDTLCRQDYIDRGEVSHLKLLLPGQLLKRLLQPILGTTSKHTIIWKMIQELRQKYYFASMATYVRNWDLEFKKMHQRVLQK